MKKILYVTGTRADYGLMKSVLNEINNHPNLSLEIAVTGMHLMSEFGNTLDNIKKDNYKLHIIDCIYESDIKNSMSSFVGNFTAQFSKKIKEINPDIILLLGDRGEMLAGAIVGNYNNLAVAHIHGGEVTSTADESVRHAITKLSHIHFPATKNSKERILKMGEISENIFVCGAPGLDSILNNKLKSKKEIFDELNLKDEKTALLIQHPVTIESDNSHEQIKATLEALKEQNIQSIIIYPNADTGGSHIIKVIYEYKNNPKFHIFENIEHETFINLMAHVDVMIGNSSSGIIESASFKLPTINIGTRQSGRERGINVIDCDYNKEEIKEKLNLALSEDFHKKMAACINPYGDGKTGKRIAEILAKIKIDKKLLQKQITY